MFEWEVGGDGGRRGGRRGKIAGRTCGPAEGGPGHVDEEARRATCGNSGSSVEGSVAERMLEDVRRDVMEGGCDERRGCLRGSAQALTGNGGTYLERRRGYPPISEHARQELAFDFHSGIANTESCADSWGGRAELETIHNSQGN